ncbi:hypothetical protein K491DRAFT_693460 [Lophiostoma macrostomum CBS 122681]|uniref:Uncharacterized protein n=1 Tax=Lophiostoma macrostomum CBS 122681 TaxID=1314788 RepID=A0A6A6T4H0_9PLEO|nr:hypothetical protein K491DRAFT_693460 [Lophiostoma macrostomum CBS 122681]
MTRPTPRMSFLSSASKYLTEPHPFSRRPITTAPHAVDYMVYARRVGRTGTFVFPIAAIILGWPLAAEKLGRRTGM